MAEHTIDLKVNVDAREAEELKRLPEDVRRQWEQLNRTLAQGPALTGARGQRMQAIATRQQELAGQAGSQGFWTPQQQQEFTRGSRESNRLWQEYWAERSQIAQRGGEELAQQIQETERALRDAQRMGDRPRAQQLSQQYTALVQQQPAFNPREAVQQVRQAKAVQQQPAFNPREAVQQVRQAKAVQQQQQRETTAAAAGIPLGERVSEERQRQAQERLTREREREARQQAEALRRVAREERYTREEQARQDRAQREQEREQRRQEQADARRTQQQAAAGLGTVGRQEFYQRRERDQAARAQRRTEQEAEREARRQQGAGGGFGGFLSGGGGGFLRSALRGLMGGGLMGTGYFVVSHIRRAFADELQRGMAVADLGQRIRPADMPYEKFREQVGRLDPSFSPKESTRFAATYSALAGARDPRTFFPQAKEATALTRAFGFTPEQGAQLFGETRQLGLASEGGQKRFAHLLAGAVQEGRLQGREGEVWQSVLDLARQSQARAGVVPELGGLTGMLARMGATGEPGLQGKFGANILSNIDKSLAETSQSLLPFSDLKKSAALSMMASDKYRNLSLADVMEKLEAGIADPEFLADFFKQAEEMYGQQNPELLSGLAQQLGIPLRHRREIFRILKESKAPEAIAQLEKRAGKKSSPKPSSAHRLTCTTLPKSSGPEH